MDTDLSNPEKVVAILRNAAGDPLCDDSIRDLAGIRNRIAVNPITHALALTRDFTREKHLCSRCGKTKLVTHATH